MESFKPPSCFSPSKEENIASAWKDWKQQFKLYLIASQKKNVDGEEKVAMLLYSLGPQWTKVFNKFTFGDDAEKNNLEVVLTKFDNYFEPKKLIKGYITRFQQRVQKPDETVADYIAAVRELASHCEFGTTEETQVCVQVSNGVLDQKLKERLWEDNCNLDKLIKRCNFHEQTQQTKKLTGTADAQVAYSQATPRGRARGRGPHRGTSRGRGRGRGQSYPSVPRGQSHPSVPRGQSHIPVFLEDSRIPVFLEDSRIPVFPGLDTEVEEEATVTVTTTRGHVVIVVCIMADIVLHMEKPATSVRN